MEERACNFKYSKLRNCMEVIIQLHSPATLLLGKELPMLTGGPQSRTGQSGEK
jgi:hypothetical protein